MKDKLLIITAIVFFLLINTSYYWEGKLGLFAIAAFVLLVAVYIGLAVGFLQQLYFLWKEKFKQKGRLYLAGLLLAVLLLSSLWPSGLINFDKLEGRDVLVAEREGAVNCVTILKLKENFTFRERTGCFGTTEVRGTFRLVNDTVYFENVRPARDDTSFYKFAVIRPSKFDNPKILADLIRYKDKSDTAGHLLWITRNELQRLTTKNHSAVKELAEK